MKIKRRLNPRALTGMLVALLILTLMLNVAQAGRVQALTLQVASSYQKALFETSSLIESIELNLEKLLVTGSSAREQDLLGDVARQSDSAQDNLSLLPASSPSISSSIKFVNQTGDFAQTLSDKLAAGGAVSDDDRELLIVLHKNCNQLKEMLNGMTEKILHGQNPFDGAQTANLPALETQGDVEPTVEYPALLYDGPFSDGRDTAQLRAIGSTEFTAEESLSRVVDFLGKERVLSAEVTGEGETPVLCHEITVRVNEGELNLAVSRQGGEILYMIFSGKTGQAKFSQAELVDLASSFLKSRGYPNVSVSYWSYFDGLLTVNFAVVQDGVILYPDLIKLQMDASTGNVVGLEALNYLTNHVYRVNLVPTLSESEAESLLGPLLEVERARLCVVPTDAGEALAWEFDCFADNNRYLIYIDAHTGLEREIYRVVEDEFGRLVI